MNTETEQYFKEQLVSYIQHFEAMEKEANEGVAPLVTISKWVIRKTAYREVLTMFEALTSK